MTPRWEDVNARARGLATHLLTRPDLDLLARQPDLPALADALGRLGVVVDRDGAAVVAEGIECGIRRWSAGTLQTLARWAGARSAALPCVFDEEDRRSLRALFRGVVAGVPSEQRLTALVPTPTLPEGALRALASASTLPAMCALLSVWGHPFAATLAGPAAAAPPDLPAVERALGRAAVASATRAAGRSGSGGLKALVAEGIDLENVTLALVLVGAGEPVPAADHFLPGGDRLTLGAFTRAIAARDPHAAARILALPFSGTGYRKVIEEECADPGRLEGALLRERIAWLTRRVRQSPLEPTTTLWVALRLRAQVIDLHRIVWTVALGAPRPPLAGRWTSVAA